MARRIKAALGWKMERQPEGSCFDYLARYEGKPQAVVEMKRRNFRWGQHETVHVSVKKITECLEAAYLHSAQFFFVVECDDGIFFVALTPWLCQQLRVKTGGRYDRGATNDVEALYDIPSTWFTKL